MTKRLDLNIYQNECKNMRGALYMCAKINNAKISTCISLTCALKTHVIHVIQTHKVLKERSKNNKSMKLNELFFWNILF